MRRMRINKKYFLLNQIHFCSPCSPSLNILLPISLMMFMKVDKYLSYKKSVVLAQIFFAYKSLACSIETLQRATKGSSRFYLWTSFEFEIAAVSERVLCECSTKTNTKYDNMALYISAIIASSGFVVCVNYFDTFSCHLKGHAFIV